MQCSMSVQLQNRRVVEAGSDPWRLSGPTAQSRQDFLRPVAQDYVQMALEYLRDGDSAAFLGQLGQCLVTLTVK